MGRPADSYIGIVLRHIKLSETDLIVHLLLEDGSKLEAIAKGARKPKSSFASRLELGNIVDFLVIPGKNLGIITEVRMIKSASFLGKDIDAFSSASPMLELLDRAIVEGQTNPKLFLLTRTAFAALRSNLDSWQQLSVSCPEGVQNAFFLYQSRCYAICLGFLLKTCAFLGFRPLFHQCLSCGKDLDFSQNQTFSYFDGGSVCSSCALHHETTSISGDVVAWCHACLHAPFEQIITFETPLDTILEGLRLTQQWCRIHLDFSLKSLNYVFKLFR